MDANMPEEMQKKVQSIEKELNDKIWFNNKLALWVSLIGILLGITFTYLYVFITNRTGFYPVIIFILAFILAGNSITRYFEHKKFSKLFSNACDVIHYYRDRTVD